MGKNIKADISGADGSRDASPIIPNRMQRLVVSPWVKERKAPSLQRTILKSVRSGIDRRGSIISTRRKVSHITALERPPVHTVRLYARLGLFGVGDLYAVQWQQNSLKCLVIWGYSGLQENYHKRVRVNQHSAISFL